MSVSVPSRLLRLIVALASGGLPLLLAFAAGGHSALFAQAAGETPEQVAATLDGIVQPRFQKDAGRFGMDRVAFAGHDNIYSLAGITASEKRRLRRVNAAHRPYVIAFLHCAHTPGRDLPSRKRDREAVETPSLQTLAAATATDAGCQKLWDWSDSHLRKIVLPNLPTLRQGTGVDQNFGNWRLVLRPVRASRDSCLGCHTGAKRGDTLGVMVYAVDRDTIHAPIQSFNDGVQ